MNVYVYYILQRLPSDILGGCQSHIHRRYYSIVNTNICTTSTSQVKIY